MHHNELVSKQAQTKNTDTIKSKRDLQIFGKQIQKISDQMVEPIEYLVPNFSKDETLPRKYA